MNFYEEALEALARLPEDAAALSRGIDVRFALREPLFHIGRITSLRTRLDEAASLAERLGDVDRLGQLYRFQGHHAWLAGDYPATIAAAQRAMALAETHHDAALKLRAVFERALGEFGRGDLAACAAGMAQVAEQAENPAVHGRFGLDARLAVVALGFQARALIDLGQFDAAELVAADCAARAANIPRPFEAIFAAVADGYLRFARGYFDDAVARLTTAVALCDQAEADLMRPVAQSFLGAAEVAAGLITAGVERLELAVQAAADMGLLFQQPLRLAQLSEALSAAGRKNAAAQRAAEALDLATLQGDQHSLVAARRATARAGQ